MAKDGPPSGTTKNLGSYYRRPSAAIERGGGFFVPGLEGYRLRFVLAAVILGLLSLDGVSRPGMSTSQVVSEVLAALAGSILLGQAFLDQQKEQAVKMRREAIAATSDTADSDESAATEKAKMTFFDSDTLGSELEGKVRWAAEILLQLTAGCSFIVFSDQKILARVGVSGEETDETDTLAAAFKGALTTIAAEDRGFLASTIVTRAAPSQKDEGAGEDDPMMRMLPSTCLQGIFCRISTRLGGRDDGVDGGNVVVLLGSTLRGSGVFSGMDGGWFERVCAHIALGNADATAGSER